MACLYTYDGSFEGLMTAIYESYYLPVKPEKILKEEGAQPEIFDQVIPIYTNEQKAEKVMAAIKEKLSFTVFQRILYAFYSEDNAAGTIVFRFLKVAFPMGKSCLSYRAHPHIGPCLDLYRQVSREAHHLMGLIRFLEMSSSVLYARFESKGYVLPILSAHFSQRLREHPFVLHDVIRKKATIFDGKDWYIRLVEHAPLPTLHSRESLFQDLWIGYFKNIAIEERKNPKCQRQNMPKKYWKYLIEKGGYAGRRFENKS